MSWVAVGVGGATALMSYTNAKQQQRAQKAQNLAAAEQTRQSPWTQMGAGQLQMGAQSPTSAALGGGLQGAMVGHSIGQGMQKAAPAAQGASQAEMTEAAQQVGYGPEQVPMSQQSSALDPRLAKKPGLYGGRDPWSIS